MKAGGEIHLHKRKQKLAKYPHPHRGIRFLDNLVLVISFLFPITALPQVWTVWVLQDAAGVSLLTWSLFFILSIPMLVYSCVHKVRPLITMYTLWLFVHASMIIGTLRYG